MARVERFKPEKLDLTGICDSPDKSLCRVYVYEDLGTKHEWLLLGRVGLNQIGSRNDRWALNAYLRDGATDGEHDSAKAVSIELVGVRYEFTSSHWSYFSGYVVSRDPDSFRVPHAAYDPFLGATKCKTCKGKEAHVFVPYLPDKDAETYRLFEGRQVSIEIGVPWDDD